MPERDQFGFRISPTGRRVLELLASYYGLTKTGVIEMLLRRAARDEGIDLPSGQIRNPYPHDPTERR